MKRSTTTKTWKFGGIPRTTFALTENVPPTLNLTLALTPLLNAGLRWDFPCFNAILSGEHFPLPVLVCSAVNWSSLNSQFRIIFEITRNLKQQSNKIELERNDIKSKLGNKTHQKILSLTYITLPGITSRSKAMETSKKQ